jgi:hypothetical protein
MDMIHIFIIYDTVYSGKWFQCFEKTLLLSQYLSAKFRNPRMTSHLEDQNVKN